MKLIEILNTKVPVEWSQVDHQHNGVFTLDDNNYKIHLDEYEVLGKTLVDFGFSANDDIAAINSGKNLARIIGAVLNGASPKIKSIDPDVILISILKSSGLVESRKSLYSTLVSWLLKRSDFMYNTEWIENEKHLFKLIAKKKLTKDQHKIFVDQVQDKN